MDEKLLYGGPIETLFRIVLFMDKRDVEVRDRDRDRDRDVDRPRPRHSSKPWHVELHLNYLKFFLSRKFF